MPPFDVLLGRAMYFTLGVAIAYLGLPPRPSRIAHDAIVCALAGLLMVWMARFYGDVLDDDDPYGMAA
jgi:hypothetical protein